MRSMSCALLIPSCDARQTLFGPVEARDAKVETLLPRALLVLQHHASTLLSNVL